LDLLRAVAGLLFCAVMTWKGAGMAWQHNDRMSTTLGTPLVIPYLLLPVGFGLLAFQYAANLGARKTAPQLAPQMKSIPERESGTGRQI
jgi:TRAP-type C4-dicarboxylate transport system permease small subunit